MSRIVYLFGAGASYGKRGTNDENYIIEGIPVVNEFSAQIERLIDKISNKDTEYKSTSKATETDKKELIEQLKWLRNSSSSHHTIDTYAKKLWVTQDFTEYEKLKVALSAFLTLMQLFYKPDSRYDAFFANIIGKRYDKLPEDVSILSWNYDCQFEIAHSAYSKRKSINSIWDDLNILAKTTTNKVDKNYPFTITKLNGTALMYEPNSYKSKLFDAFFNRQGMSEINYVVTAYLKSSSSNNVKNALSFAWEGYDDRFEDQYKSKTIDTEVLVIIGYSFPYFNREVDRIIIRNMPNLRKVYIQDPNCEDVKESFEATLSVEQLEKVENGQIKIVLKKGTQQFLIPNEM